ncbi:hypothetical protein [Nitrosomonas communis]|uniref:Nucleotidyltransferase domain-containing protein n=1 Tax=Nitrosomonas communis TaxID=44574 RepID=A0A1H2YQN6_9PROT|nr:hypothetical protein [Nitrosomonas communis]SDX06954.1 hypothetical protein SAMN05421882_105515 [Nitrosomonas communis]
MSRDWESVFSTWGQSPSATEQQRAENAERQIREAIRASDKLKNRNIRVFTQGSYRNRVNVRKDSDVDIGVLCFDTYFPDYPDDNVNILGHHIGQLCVVSAGFPCPHSYHRFRPMLRKSSVGTAVIRCFSWERRAEMRHDKWLRLGLGSIYAHQFGAR